MTASFATTLSTEVNLFKKLASTETKTHAENKTFSRYQYSFTLKGCPRDNWGLNAKRGRMGAGGGEATTGYLAQTGLLFPFLKNTIIVLNIILNPLSE